jgi:hypothetical protein
MKNRCWFNILTPLVAAVFILSLFSGNGAAEKPGEKNENQEKYANTGKQFEDAKKQFENALKQFNAKKDSKSKEELLLKTKDYLDKAIDHLVSYLKVLKSRAEKSDNKGIIPFDVSKNIDAHVTELEQLRTKVLQANSTQELRDANKELKELWIKIRLETQYDFEILLNNRIDKFITKADNISARLDASIQNLKSKSKDTSDLEKDAASFNSLVKEAKDAQQKTSALFASHSGFATDGTVTNIKDAEAFIRQADNSQKEIIKKLKAASRQLQDFVRDFRKLSGGKVVVSGTGTLAANGTGRAVIEGNVTVTLSGINGTLKVSSNAKVTTDGGTNETLGNGEVKYQGFNSATIKGENIRVEISGNNIDLTATGTGSAVLSGNGTYKTEKDFGVSGEWKKEG